MADVTGQFTVVNPVPVLAPNYPDADKFYWGGNVSVINSGAALAGPVQLEIDNLPTGCVIQEVTCTDFPVGNANRHPPFTGNVITAFPAGSTWQANLPRHYQITLDGSTELPAPSIKILQG